MTVKWLLTFSLLLSTFITKGQFEDYLVGYYPFENGQATDLTDRGGDGTIYGDLQIVEGVNGEAIRFDGGDHNIVFQGKVNRYLRGRRDFTISFYFRSDDLDQRSSLIGKRNYCDGNRMFDLRLFRGKLKAEMYERSRPRIRNNLYTSIPNQRWHHYVYVRKGTTVRLFVDGLLQDSGRIPRVISVEDEAYFSINSSPCKGVDGTGNLRGSMDELKIFNEALSRREVAILFDANNRRPAPSYQREQLSNENLKNPNRQQRPNISKKNNTPTDARLNAIFGKYEDLESKSSLMLEPKRFILKIENPEGYETEELVYIGKYKIEEGDLILLQGEVNLKKQNGEIQKIPYKEKIIGDLYENGVDLFGFETRMQLKK